MSIIIDIYDESWRRGCECDRLWVRFPLEDMKYNKFSFLRSGVEAKRSVEFRHSMSSEFAAMSEM